MRAKKSHQVRVARCEDAHELALSLIDAISEQWPRPDRVAEFDCIDLDSLDTSVRCGAILVVFSEQPELAKLSRMIYAFLDEDAAAIILVPEDSQDATKFERSGIIIERLDADPARLAAELFALCERQATVNDIALSLRTNALASGGAQGELERIHEELQLAAMVQRELIPRVLPTDDNLDIGVLYRPTGYVSGDIYDVFELGDNRVGFLLADAMGHGVPAALMTMLVSKGLRKWDREEDGSMRALPPAEAIEWLNKEMCECSGGSGQRFVTGVYAVIDRESGMVTACNAGHPPPMLVRTNGVVEPIETCGPLLGVFDSTEYEQMSIQMRPGDTLIMYTDGFETAFPNEDSLGVPTVGYISYLTEIAHSNQTPLTERILQLVSALDGHVGSLHQDDDLTIVAFTYKPQAVQAKAA